MNDTASAGAPDGPLPGNSKISPPVVPSPDLLPLHDSNFSWEKFQNFSRAFISLQPGVKEAHHYGKLGSDQKGIDLYSDLETGQRHSYQCRQVLKFTKKDFEKLVAETSFAAEHRFVLVACEVDSTVRDEFEKHPCWTLWDIHDISGEVRKLPAPKARKLVQEYFGADWVSGFLHLPEVSPIETPADFFKDLLDPARLFNHVLAMVGRNESLQKLHDFIRSPKAFAFLAGRGGIGKSRLLKEFADTFTREQAASSLHFLKRALPLTPAVMNELPEGRTTLVLDDAHQYADLPLLVALARKHQPPVKLLLTFRPYAIESIRSHLRQADVEAEEIEELAELKELTRDDVKALAKEALGPEFDHLAVQLADASWDSPLVTVIGGRLIARKALPLSVLERDSDFRQAVLGKFRDAVLGQFDDRIPKDRCQALLRLVSAIQPVRLTPKGGVLGVASQFLNIPQHDLLRTFGYLEEAGIILRRGELVRITPDVLADYILHDACLTSQGQATGYADEILSAFGSVCPSPILRNLGELDWRVRSAGTEPPDDLLAGLWQTYEESFRSATNLGRNQILGLLRDVAVYQPERILRLVEYAIRNPSTAADVGAGGKTLSFGHEHVLRAIPELLRLTAFSIAHLPRSMELLWELGREDPRTPTGSDHGLSLLLELARFQFGKPLKVQELLLDAVARWLGQPDAPSHAHSPLELLPPFFAKIGESHETDGMNLVMTAFEIERETSRPLRERALALLDPFASSKDSARVLRVIDILEGALRRPPAIYGITIKKDFLDACVPEELEILDRLDMIRAQSSSSIVHLKVVDTLRWHARHAFSEKVREKSRSIILSVGDSFELRLTKSLLQNSIFDAFDDEDPEGEPGARMKNARDRIALEKRAVVAEFIGQFADPKKGASMLAGNLEIIDQCGIRPDPGGFLVLLAQTNVSYAVDLAQEALRTIPSALARHLGSLLEGVHEIDPASAHRLAGEGLRKEHRELAIAVAIACVQWVAAGHEEDRDTLRELLRHPDKAVVRISIMALPGWGSARTREAIDLALSADVGKDPDLVAMLCSIFRETGVIPLSELTPDDLKAILARIEPLSNLKRGEVVSMLEYAATLEPMLVMEMLLRRIERAAGDQNLDYEAIPLLGFDGKLRGIAHAPNYAGMLSLIRDRMLTGHPSIRYPIARLFEDIAGGYDPTSLAVLKEWIDSGDERRIRLAARLLPEGDEDFLFGNPSFIENLLEKAHAAGAECDRTVSEILVGMAMTGERTGAPGQPFPQDLAIQSQAQELAKEASPGSRAERFYTDLSRRAGEVIERDRLREEEESI